MYSKDSVNQLQKGLVTDSSKSNQLDGTYSYALNAVNETKEGDFGYLSNELGNKQCSSLTIDGKAFSIIGHTNLLNNETLLFLATEDQSQSIIAIQKATCQDLQIVLKQPCLNFSVYHQIKSVYRVRKGCNRTIYFVDKYNSDRVIDIDEILQNPVNNKYINQFGQFDCDLVKMSPNFQIPNIDYISTNKTGGNLQLGMYEFSVSLGDKDLNFTNWISVTNPIPVIDSDFSGVYGAMGGNPINVSTNQSITLDINNLDLNYDYVKIGVIETIGGVITPYEVVTLPITQNSLSYTYSGLDYNTATILTLSDIAAPRIVYDRSLTIEQQDQRLVRGNVSEKVFDYATLQRAAFLINTTYVTKPKRYKDFNNSVISGNYYFDNRSYMRDEIYALGIKAIFDDGTETPVMHIPGREIDSAYTNGQTDPNRLGQRLLTNRNPPNGGWDSTVYSIQPLTVSMNLHTQVALDDVEHLGLNVNQTVKRWEVFNTALRTYCADTLSTEIYSKGALSYWESTFLYPGTKDCSSKPIYAKFDQVTGLIQSDYSNTPIRHHKMPDTTLEPHFLNTNLNGGLDEDDYILPLGLEFDLTNFNIYLSNFLDPVQFGRIQGYKIVRALRNKGNKTVIDKGLSYKNIFWQFNDGSGSSVDPTRWSNYQTPLLGRFTQAIRSGGVGIGLTYLIPLPDYPGTGSLLIDAPPEPFFNIIDKSNLLAVTPPANNCEFGNAITPTNNNLPNHPDHRAAGCQWYDPYNISYHGPKSKFLNTNLSASYLKYDKQIWGKLIDGGPLGSVNGTVEDDKKLKASYKCIYNNPPTTTNNVFIDGNTNSGSTYYGTPQQRHTNRVINKQVHIQPNTVQTTNLTYQFRNGTQQETYVLELNKKIDNEDGLSSTDLITQDGLFYGGGPHDGFWQEGFTSPVHTILFPFQVDGTTYEPTSKAFYTSLKAVNKGCYSQISSLIYRDISMDLIPLGTTNVIEYSGDCFISLLGFKRTLLDLSYNSQDSETIWTNLVAYYAESEINTALRHLSYGAAIDVVKSQYYPKFSTFQDIFAILLENDLIYNGLAPNSDTNTLINLYQESKNINNVYNYNQDYSKELNEKPSFPLAQGFDYCSQCINSFPHRIIYSEKSYQEEQADNYLKVLPNSYRDLPGNSGQITTIFKKNDELCVRTWQSLWMLYTRPQTLQTNTGEIQIGTGSFFEIPPKELVSTNTGYAGGQTRWDLSINTYGAFFADAAQGIVFNFNQGLKEISLNGMKKWFFDNLPFNLPNVYSIPDYLLDNPASNNGIGLIGTYDPNLNRYILTKRDYIPLNNLPTIFNINQNKWNVQTGPSTFIIIDNPYESSDYFENKSWTISYDCERNQWVSFHSYIPNYTYNTQINHYSSINSSNPYIWLHNKGDYQKFYDITYPHIFEYITNQDPLITKATTITKYISDTLLYDGLIEDYVNVIDKTYDKVVFYNDYQTSGELLISVKNLTDPFSSLNYDPSIIQVEALASDWNMNGFRDMTIQTSPKQPLFTKTWNNIKSQFPIDKVPNYNIINYLTKSQFDMARFKDKYLAVRLFFTQPDKHKIITKYLTNKNEVNLR